MKQALERRCRGQSSAPLHYETRRRRQEAHMAEDGGTLLYMTVGLLLMVGAIVAMTGRR